MPSPPNPPTSHQVTVSEHTTTVEYSRTTEHFKTTEYSTTPQQSTTTESKTADATSGTRSIPEPDFCPGDADKIVPGREAGWGVKEKENEKEKETRLRNISGVKMDPRAYWYPGRSGF
jgi:hypothetical protein